MKWNLVILLSLGIGICFKALANEGKTVRKPSSVSPEQALHAFEHLHRVALHTRCTNCHSQTETPLQGEVSIPHSFLVSRKIKTLGYACNSCHASQGENFSPLPPRAAHWDMPAREKSLHKGMSAADLCELWKDPQKNFFETGGRVGEGRSLEDLLEHIQTDALVKWSFDPGFGRVPAPEGHTKFVAKFTEWIDGGAPCPAR